MREQIAQLVGVVAMLVAFLSFQAKTSRKILILQATANCIWTVHYLILGAYTGAMLNLFAVARNITYSFLNKKETVNKTYYAIGFAVLCIVLSLFTYQNLWSLLPMIGSTIQTFSFACKNANKLRLFTLMGSPFWLTYNLASTSIAGTITELVCMCSMLIGMWRYREKTNK